MTDALIDYKLIIFYKIILRASSSKGRRIDEFTNRIYNIEIIFGVIRILCSILYSYIHDYVSINPE